MKHLNTLVKSVEQWLEETYPWTLVLFVLWVMFGWPLYLACFLDECLGGKHRS